MENFRDLMEAKWSDLYHNDNGREYTWEVLLGFLSIYRDNIFDPYRLWDSKEFKEFKASILSEDRNIQDTFDIDLRITTALEKVLKPIEDGSLTLDIYRDIAVDSTDEIDFNDLGVCWTWNKDNQTVKEFILPKNKKYRVHMVGEVDADDVNWFEGIVLYLHYEGSEDEVRVYDQGSITLVGYAVYDRWTDEKIMEWGAD